MGNNSTVYAQRDTFEVKGESETRAACNRAANVELGQVHRASPRSGPPSWRPVMGTHLCNCHAQQQEGWRDEEHSPRLGYLSKHMPEHDS